MSMGFIIFPILPFPSSGLLPLQVLSEPTTACYFPSLRLALSPLHHWRIPGILSKRISVLPTYFWSMKRVGSNRSGMRNTKQTGHIFVPCHPCCFVNFFSLIDHLLKIDGYHPPWLSLSPPLKIQCYPSLKDTLYSHCSTLLSSGHYGLGVSFVLVGLILS